ncbi:MAG: hypothetical protein Kow00109_18920 [Acidobacteriota bacterium]
MKIVLRQVFPLGRFHATPWRANPFDDPHGEWPPSPWRFARAVVARWYQWARESPEERPHGELDLLVKALCTSSYAFRLPPTARKGSPLRQYFPADFGMDPPNYKEWEAVICCSREQEERIRQQLGGDGTVERRGEAVVIRVKKARAKKRLQGVVSRQLNWKGLRPDPGLRSYSKSLAQDNYWCTVPGEDGAVWWFIEGPDWNTDLLKVLDRCLERVTYFGRAETFTRIQRVTNGYPEPNCKLLDQPRAGATPVLVPLPEATRADLERTTEDDRVAARSIPPGAAYRFAVRPPRPTVYEDRQLRPRPARNLIQFAIGWNVAPELRAVARLTSRFRGAVLRELLSIKSNGKNTAWSRAPRALREKVALMAGKDAHGRPLQGHQHTEFFVWYEERTASRLLAWRDSEPFDPDEEAAILAAAAQEMSWAAPGDDADAWKVRLVPLDRAVPPPPGFDNAKYRTWESVTPYVPPRHYLRGGKPRERESVENQVRRELSLRGYVQAESVQVEVLGAQWVAVHFPRGQRAGRAFLGERRGYRLRVEFPEPVRGPLRIGHSSSFGLGLFRPVECECNGSTGPEDAAQA